jgi:hypothetical protein
MQARREAAGEFRRIFVGHTVGSTALAGAGNFDLAEVFGDDFSATTALGGNGLFDILGEMLGFTM